MKVLHLISGGDKGGAKTHLITLLKELLSKGIDVELLCIMEGSFTDEAREAKIPITIINQDKRYSIKPILEIKKFIKDNKFDIIHCHGARANYIAFFIKNSLNTPFITTLHSDYKLDFKDSFYKQAIFMPINAIALRKFDYILAVTNSFKEMLISRGFKNNNIEVIYNGIDMKSDLQITPKEDFLKKYDILYDESFVYVGMVARLQVVKGPMEFLEASKNVLDKFKNKDKNIMFLMAGDGDMELELKEFISKNNLVNNVKMLGFVKDVNSFYNAIDINTLTSHSESFPYALLEGARLKKATIATSVGGIPEMIKNNKTGILVQAKDTGELSNKIEELINNKEVMQELGENFYKDVSKKFSSEKMANKHIEIYSKICFESLNI